ncbi:MAG TPA: peptidoglycan DD-metalloendopeptidase family protein [Dehalococcoidia bacterium]|nr:peptidoglycan DD-metalloendopeptidase family protein [Dehalococcoidia bacterium]
MLLGVSGGAGAVTGSLRGEPDKAMRSVESDSSYIRPPLVLHTASGSYQLTGSLPTPLPSPTATPDPTLQAAVQASTLVTVRPYFTYTVQPGDTLSSISRNFGVSSDYLVWNNPEVGRNVNSLLVGQQLLVPAINGIVYTLVIGDTLADVADYFGISVSAIVNYGPNGVSSADKVSVGTTVVLPGAVPPASVAPAPPTPAPAPPAPPVVAVAVPPAPPVAVAPAPPPPVASAGFIWPFIGPISSPFGDGRGHTGIDIDGFGREGSTIVAAAAGQVVYTAYLGYGYGYHIIIDHGNGFSTLYAHLSDIWVSPGQYVAQGEGIGVIGCTGYCTGTHLHFEIRIGGVPVDPMGYLP